MIKAVSLSATLSIFEILGAKTQDSFAAVASIVREFRVAGDALVYEAPTEYLREAMDLSVVQNGPEV